MRKVIFFFNPKEAILLFPEAVEKGNAERGRRKARKKRNQKRTITLPNANIFNLRKIIVG